jgi:ABC-type transport system substrate-binding protein
LRFEPQVDAFRIVRYALGLVQSAREGDTALQACWGELLGEVRRTGARELRLTLRQPHVLPEALLALLPSEAGPPQAALGAYQPIQDAAGQVRYVARGERDATAGGPAEIVERVLDDPQQAVQALLRGEVDVIERLLPADLPSLAGRSEVAVLPYAAPTVHVLLIRSKNPYVLSATFRRALVYGADRELLLRDGLLRGQSLPDCRLISGPFPAPTSSRDDAAYAYDPQIEPRPYDPQLALALRLVAEQEVAAAATQPPQTPRLPLRLAHPAHELARIACRGLAQQWERIGIPCTLIELSPGQFDAPQDTCDLLYAELAAWEPLVDALRLFNPQGLVPQASPAVMALARQAARARNWPQAREHLLLVHRLVHEELPVLPLWQWRDQFACRRGVDGIQTPRLDLYQQLKRWRIDPPLLAGRMP